MPVELYPPGFATRVSVPGLDRQLCSVSRPHFFTGVATVVARLLSVTRCDLAAFGEKDFQQLTIIRRMVTDLALPCEIVGVPIQREPDGLAMSSRNVYLSESDRQRATSLSRTLRALQARVADGQTDVAALLREGRASLDVDDIDYLQIVDIHSLEPLAHIRAEARVAVAAVLGKTRLIDNMALVPPEA
jgi:pantoate--beta-alanine ligase